MGGFANLKREFEENDMLGTYKQSPSLVTQEGGFNDMSAFLLLRCLFEIAGNLDTIAVEMRDLRKHFAPKTWAETKNQE